MAWTTDRLKMLRKIGDPRVDDSIDAWLSRCSGPDRQRDELNDKLQKLVHSGPASRLEPDKGIDTANWLLTEEPAQRCLDGEKLALAQDLFRRYGKLIGAALVLAGLPQAYAATNGVQVLAQTERLASHPGRRIAETAQFLIDVMWPPHGKAELEAGPEELLRPGGRGFRAARDVRLLHALIRKRLTIEGDQGDREPWDEKNHGKPINQEDLLGTLMTFSIGVFEVLDKLDVTWTTEEREAYFHVWDWVGELMGIGHPAEGESGAPIRPGTVAEGSKLLSLIRTRQWPPPTEDDPLANLEGRELTWSLLNALRDALPPGFEWQADAAMRYLAGPDVSRILWLGNGALWERWAAFAPRERFHLGEGVVVERPNRHVAAFYRRMASFVAQQAFISFMLRTDRHEREPFRLPGFDRLVQQAGERRSLVSPPRRAGARPD